MDGAIAKLVSVAFGGAIGSVARYLINISPVQQLFGKFPASTFLINVTGSFLIGFFLVLFTNRFPHNEGLRLLVIVGFLGAFTTFSAFELEIWGLIEKHRYIVAFTYLFLSVFVGFIGVVLGIALGRKCC